MVRSFDQFCVNRAGNGWAGWDCAGAYTIRNRIFIVTEVEGRMVSTLFCHCRTVA